MLVNEVDSVTIEGYQIKKMLARSASSSLYLANQKIYNRNVLLKVIYNQPQLTSCFELEAHLLARLSHPGVVSVYDIGKQADYQYMSMAYYGGGNLKDKLTEGVSLKRALIILRQLALSLAYLHDHDVIHRDLKPSNIVFGRAMYLPIITDFGVACDATTAPLFKPQTAHSFGNGFNRQTETTAGTPTYMSPEQAKGERLDGRSDLYSLGIIFYEMLMGNPPFSGGSAYDIAVKHCQAPVPELPSTFAHFQTLLDKLLAKKVTYRFSDAQAVVEALDDYLDTLKTPNLMLPYDANAMAKQTPAAAELAPVVAQQSVPTATSVTKLQRADKQVVEQVKDTVPMQDELDVNSTISLDTQPAAALSGNTTDDALTAEEQWLAQIRQENTKHNVIDSTLYNEQDYEEGWLLSSKITRTVSFSADSFNVFMQCFDKLNVGLDGLLKQYGRKVKRLDLEIRAEPWIHQHILTFLDEAAVAGNKHKFGRFCTLSTVTLHLYDALDSDGEFYLIRDKGKEPK